MPKWTEQPAYSYYIAFIAWISLTLLGNVHPHAIYLIDPIRTFVAGFLIAREWYRLPSFGRIRWGESSMIGLAAGGIWIMLSTMDGRYPLKESGFNPELLFGPGEITYGLYFFHLLGMVVVVPMIEELFWRGFFMRYVIDKNFQIVAIGTYTLKAFLVTTIFMALMHGPDWPKALVSTTILGLWFVYTRSLGNVMVAHTVANLFLGLYVLLSKSWQLW